MIKFFVLYLTLFNAVALPQMKSVLIELSNGALLEYDITEIKEISFIGNPTGIEETKIINDILKTFTLHQNFPNPFNPNTTITYEIPNAGLVEVQIFDIQGKLVRSLESSLQPEGLHSLSWNGIDNSGSPVASGAYICRIQFKNNYLVNKLLLIK